MPNWKKVIVSGSNASLNSITASNGAVITGSLLVSGSTVISGSANINQSISTPLINVLSGSLNEGIIDINNSINSWIYSGKSFSITSQETAPVGVFFKSDGTKMYINGSSGDDINEYNLGTAWDVTTAVFSTLFSTTQDTAPSDLFFSSDGTRLYIAGDTNNTIFQYSLGTAWDISTATYSSISFSVAAKDTNPSGIFFKSDGTKMYVCGLSSDSVHEYDLGTAWNVSTATFLQSFSVSSQDTTPASINFNNDGTKFYIVGSTNDNIYEYNLGTPWNISTAVYYGRTYVGNQEATPTGLYVTTDNVYVVGSTSDAVFQYYSNTNALRLTSDSLILNTELISTTGSVSIYQNLDIGGNAKIVGTVTAGTFSGAGSFSSLTSTSTTTLASSTAAQTVALGSGATLAATTKTINIGTSGVATSITNVNIGSAVVGSLGTVTINSNTIVTGSLTVFSGSAIDFQVTDTGTKIGNLITDNHTITGSVYISGTLAVGATGSGIFGRIDASNDIVAFSTSDIGFKENIYPIGDSLEKITRIGGYTFDWKTDEELVSLHGHSGHDIGVIAQEIESILPEIVITRDNGYKAVKYEKIVPLLIEAIKELKAEVDSLKAGNYKKLD
jgi:hypothetical protein